MSLTSKKLLFQSFYFFLLSLILHCVVFQPRILISSGKTGENIFSTFTNFLLICLVFGVSNTKPLEWSRREWGRQKKIYKRNRKAYYFLVGLFLIKTFISILFKSFIVTSLSKASNISYVVEFFFAVLYEELIFKAFWYRGLTTETSIPFVFVALIVSLLFSLFHVSYYSYWPSLVDVFIWQFISVIFFHYCSSIWLSTVLHFGNNLILFFVKTIL